MPCPALPRPPPPAGVGCSHAVPQAPPRGRQQARRVPPRCARPGARPPLLPAAARPGQGQRLGRPQAAAAHQLHRRHSHQVAGGWRQGGGRVAAGGTAVATADKVDVLSVGEEVQGSCSWQTACQPAGGSRQWTAQSWQRWPPWCCNASLARPQWHLETLCVPPPRPLLLQVHVEHARQEAEQNAQKQAAATAAAVAEQASWRALLRWGPSATRPLHACMPRRSCCGPSVGQHCM
jgi:hypothetical protein